MSQRLFLIATAHSPRAARGGLLLAVSLLALPLAGCGGTGSASGGSGGGGPVIIAPTPTPTTPAPTPTPSATPTPTPANWAEAAAALYDVQPNFATCDAGVLKAAVRTEFLNRVNALRALHQLAPVTYSSTENNQVDQSSLMMAGARTLSHSPPSSWACYTARARKARHRAISSAAGAMACTGPLRTIISRAGSTNATAPASAIAAGFSIPSSARYPMAA